MMIFITILTLIVAKALPVLNTNLSTIHFTRISSLVLFFSSLLSIQIFNIQSIGNGIGLYSGLFHITQINIYFEILILIIGGLIIIGIYKNTSNKSIDYTIIILFSILGSILLLSSYDILSLYLSLELQSFGLYILSTLYRDSYSSTSSGLKYFLLGGLSSCIILLGIGLIYSYTGLTNYESLYILNSSSNSIGLNIGILLVFIGLLFKISAAPLHNWSPDVYDGVPTIVTTYLTIIPKISILILMLELLSNIVNSNHLLIINVVNLLEIGEFNQPLQNLLLISSLLSLIIGSILGLAQIKIKRLLAYSTISHIGFILLALGINTSQSIDSFLFYILQYTITNLNIFLIILGLSYILKKESDINYLNEFIGIFKYYPILSICFCICLFSMAGIPPLLGFFSKQYVLYASLQNGYYLISFVGIIVSVISASYYLKIVKLIMNNDSNNNIKDNISEISNIHSYIISCLTLFILLFFINPNIILNSTQLLSLSLFYI